MKRFAERTEAVVKDFEDCSNALVNWFESQGLDAKEAVALMGYMVSAMIRGEEQRKDFLETMRMAWRLDAD